MEALTAAETMKTNSFEAFIFEHYYAYTKINTAATEEYKINHRSWKINEVLIIILQLTATLLQCMESFLGF